jgi:hypothetical protein
VPAVAQSKEGRAANGDGMRRCVVTLPTQLTEHPASDWFSASFAGTERANPLMIKHASVGCVPCVQRPLLKLKLPRSPRLRSSCEVGTLVAERIIHGTSGARFLSQIAGSEFLFWVHFINCSEANEALRRARWLDLCHPRLRLGDFRSTTTNNSRRSPTPRLSAGPHPESHRPVVPRG